MTTLFATLLILAGLVIVYQFASNRVLHIECEDYRNKFHQSLSKSYRDPYILHEWENRDLIPKWEKCYPHVQHMPENRKYGEWATFCANYMTREEMERQIGKALAA